MKLEGVTVCMSYSDFLAETLQENMQYFDRFVVVTSHEDKATQALCERMSVPCVVTDVATECGEKFNKGKAINIGLGHLTASDWVLHLDADIVLPQNFRKMLQHARLRPENLYGADRVNVYGWESWTNQRAARRLSHTYRYLINAPEGLSLGARVIHEEFGYCPIGFFQLWHGKKRYPIHQGNAEHSDLLFALQWPRHNRQLLPEVFCMHLDSQEGPGAHGINWQGRKSPWFGPKKHHHHPHGYRPGDKK